MTKKNIIKNVIGLILMIFMGWFVLNFVLQEPEMAHQVGSANSGQHYMEMQIAQQKNLNELNCQKLSEEKGKSLILIEGKVVEAGVSSSEVKDCLPSAPNCKHFISKRTTYALLQPNNVNQEKIRAVTKLEPITEILSKPLKLKKGESYRFCAHLDEKIDAYKIDYLSTLKPLNTKSQNINMLSTNSSEELYCKQLGEKNGRELHFVQGEVMESGLNLPSPEDCFGDCENYVRLRSSYAEIKLLNMTVAGKETIGIGMRKEPEDELLKNPLRFQIGGKYGFCGEFYPKKEEYITTKDIFYIEFLDSIEEIK